MGWQADNGHSVIEQQHAAINSTYTKRRQMTIQKKNAAIIIKTQRQKEMLLKTNNYQHIKHRSADHKQYTYFNCPQISS